jgi:hypothetical protein
MHQLSSRPTEIHWPKRPLLADSHAMALATLMFSGRDWLLPAAGFVVAGLALLVWSYWRARADG